MGTKRLKTQAFVNNLKILIANEEDFMRMGRCLDEYCLFSGARVSKTKTIAMGLGAWRGRNHWPIDWIASTDEIKLLGIHYSPTIQQTAERNWKRINNKISGILV